MSELNHVSAITFAIKNLWQLKDTYTMNLILFEDDEIECEMDETAAAQNDDNDEDAVNGKRARVIYLKQDDYRCKHIETVLKAQSGDNVRVGIVNGKQGFATITWSKDIAKTNTNSKNENDDPLNLKRCKIRKFHLKLQIIESSMQHVIDPIAERITLILAIPRPKVLNRLFPILSSLGIKELILVNARKVEKAYFQSKYLEENRSAKALMAGLVQCRDTKMPQLHIEKDLKKFLTEKLPRMYPSQQSIRIVAHPGEYLPRISELDCFKDTMDTEQAEDDKLEMSLDEQTHDALIAKQQEMKQDDDGDNDASNANKPCKESKQFILLIGPEGGWLDEEISMFQQNDFNVCSLGMRILRTDVATISLISILRSHVEQYLSLR